MSVSLSDLPPQYQQQVMRKYLAQEAKRGKRAEIPERDTGQSKRKYHNTPTERITESGAVLRFDSQKEARRYDALLSRLQSGEIRDLRLQVDFTLQEAYTTTEGKRVRAIRYKADFTYWARDGESWRRIVEDVKTRATSTEKYKIKKKLFVDKFGFEIMEV